MLAIGVVQVVWALIHLCVTRQSEVRNHFLIYGGGVIGYFLIWWLMFDYGGSTEAEPLFLVHFFGGASILCVYHIWIVVKSFQLRRAAEMQAYLA